MAEIWQGVKSVRDEEALAILARRARHDLEMLNYPPADWVPEAAGPDGKPMLDALIVGGGMCGQTAAFALMREGVRKVRVIDRCARGDEGPWGTYARMEILRSPKHLTGPDLGVPSLTFRAWYEAQHGEDGWAQLYKVGRIDWRDYLLWVRDTVGVEVENGTALVAIEPTASSVRATLESAKGREDIWARKIVLAGGRDGAGALRLPQFPGLDRASAEARRRVLHSTDGIEPEDFTGKRVGVLGAGASAFDCAATALEGGAAEVAMFVRRPHLPQVNKSKGASYPGFLRAFGSLSDADRWRLQAYIFGEQAPPPHESVLRCDVHPNFSIRFAEPWTDVQPDAAGVRVVTAKGRFDFDAVILATGFDIDLEKHPLLAPLAGNILLWRDRIAPELAAQDPECARHPYLGAGFELIAHEPDRMQVLDRIHMFNVGATMSHAALAGDIPGLQIGARRLADAIVAHLFEESLPELEARLRAHDERELAPTRYLVP
ncbi:NAD(P)/FAD-dependent oxidoreductase [Hyphomicrobium sp. CS1BSMeth3]|uniref:FAD/NAD(P)-binding protein n=1 Tax=Hyphomicrobium sp. CS1BSMeth3 TaxID=1892844 RepID=UPI000930F9E5|nr:NAD(P)/FAD-dependent oxidoreductase [Hyphomicrobium sp. CS1BSMeth3]